MIIKLNKALQLFQFYVQICMFMNVKLFMLASVHLVGGFSFCSPYRGLTHIKVYSQYIIIINPVSWDETSETLSQNQSLNIMFIIKER